MASEILLMRIGQCIKDLGTLKEVISKSKENESKYAEIKTLVIDVLGELASETPDKSAVEYFCYRLKEIAQEYNDAGDNLEMKKAACGLAGRIVLLKVEEYAEFLEKIVQDDRYGAINYLLQNIENEMSPAKLYDEAWEAYRSTNYEKTLKYASLAKEKGSLEAYLLLGLLYDDKAWDKHDEKRAYEIYKEGAVKGDAECQYMVYLRLMTGGVVAQNIEEAYEWLVKSANGESPFGMTALGKVYCQQSMARYTEAFQWFEKAADKGNIEAKVWIGYCYEKGYGVGRDINRAKTIYQQEMNNGNRFAKEFYDNLLDKERRIAEESRRREEQRRRDEERRIAEEKRRREEQRRREEEQQRRRDEERRRNEARRRKEEEERKKKRKIGCGCILVLLLLGLLWAGYEFWFKDYLRDRNAPRTYVYATNLFLRSSKDADSESNRMGKIPYGAEVITYETQNDWAEVKFNGVTGYVSSDYLLSYDDFRLLDGVWGNEEAKEMVMTSKCRRAILDFLKKSNWKSGSDAWQIYTKAKEVQPNSVLYPSLNDGYPDFSEFVFILTNNQTRKRKLALYAFKKDETPVFRHMEDAPDKGDIKSVSYTKWNNKYRVVYSGQSTVGNASQKNVKPKTIVRTGLGNTEIPVTMTVEEGNSSTVAGTIISCHDDLEFTLLGCKISGTTATLEMMVENVGKSSHKLILYGGSHSYAYDDQGNRYHGANLLVAFSGGYYSSNSEYKEIPSGIKTKFTLKIEHVDKIAASFGNISIDTNKDTRLVLKNVPIKGKTAIDLPSSQTTGTVISCRDNLKFALIDCKKGTNYTTLTLLVKNLGTSTETFRLYGGSNGYAYDELGNKYHGSYLTVAFSGGYYSSNSDYAYIPSEVTTWVYIRIANVEAAAKEFTNIMLNTGYEKDLVLKNVKIRK